MKVNCIGCNRNLNAVEELQRCPVCKVYFGLTPYFPHFCDYREWVLKNGELIKRSKK